MRIICRISVVITVLRDYRTSFGGVLSVGDFWNAVKQLDAVDGEAVVRLAEV